MIKNFSKKNTVISEIAILICAFLWGIISFFTLPLTNEYGFNSLEITFVRSLLSVIFIGCFILIKNKKLFKIKLKDLPFIVCTGLLFLFLCATYTISIEKNGSALASMLQYTSPIWTLIFSYFLFKEKVTLKKILCLLGVLIGCALLTFAGEIKFDFVGILIGLLVGLLLATYNITCKYANMKNESETVTFYIFIFSCLGSFFISKGWNIVPKICENPISLLYLSGLSLLSTTIAYILFSFGLKSVSAGKASILSVFEIVIATCVGLIFFDINPGIFGFIGIVITMISIILIEVLK